MFKKVSKAIFGKSKTEIEWCSEFETTRAASRGVDIASIVNTLLGNDTGNVTKLGQTILETYANSIQDKYSCKEPKNILLKRENYLDPSGNMKRDIFRWSGGKLSSAYKNTFNFTKELIKATPNALKKTVSDTYRQLNIAQKYQNSFQSNWAVQVKNPTQIFSDGQSIHREGWYNLSDLPITNQPQTLSQFISSGYSKPLNVNSLININNVPQVDSSGAFKLHIEETEYRNGAGAGYAAQINSLPTMIMPEALPSNVGSVNNSGFSLMGVLKGAGVSIANWFSGLSVFNSRNGMVNGGFSPIMIGGGIDRLFFHSGGTVPGQGEVLAILRGGERVRTKAQEEELQRELNKKQLLSIMASKEEGNKKRENLPIHMQMTKDDENFILNIIVSAIERNKFGLRNIIRAL